MKCRFCGGREFRFIVHYVEYVEYNEKDDIVTSDLKDSLGDEPNSHYCIICEKVIKDRDLVSEGERGNRKCI